MLKQRVITALVLLALLLPALLAETAEPLAGLTLVLIAAGAWEWGRLNGLAMRGSLRVAAVCVMLCLFSWSARWAYDAPSMVWSITGAAWVLAAAWLIRHGVSRWATLARSLRLVAGLLALWLTWVAMYQAKVMGVNFLLSVLFLVWMADIAAYFSGRAFGRRKLAPAISPGKSWEGVWGGMVGVLLMAGTWIWIDTAYAVDSASLFTRLYARGGPFLVLATLFLVMMSVAGDLVESLVKRSAGMKDSSQLLPGHGGVLDRVDALLPALPLALMLVQSL
ncbi:MAG: phosphatidate cytidylyltransferase [Limnohabitans sp.]